MEAAGVCGLYQPFRAPDGLFKLTGVAVMDILRRIALGPLYTIRIALQTHPKGIPLLSSSDEVPPPVAKDPLYAMNYMVQNTQGKTVEHVLWMGNDEQLIAVIPQVAIAGIRTLLAINTPKRTEEWHRDNTFGQIGHRVLVSGTMAAAAVIASYPVQVRSHWQIIQMVDHPDKTSSISLGQRDRPKWLGYYRGLPLMLCSVGFYHATYWGLIAFKEKINGSKEKKQQQQQQQEEDKDISIWVTAQSVLEWSVFVAIRLAATAVAYPFETASIYQQTSWIMNKGEREVPSVAAIGKEYGRMANLYTGFGLAVCSVIAEEVIIACWKIIGKVFCHIARKVAE